MCIDLPTFLKPCSIFSISDYYTFSSTDEVEGCPDNGNVTTRSFKRTTKQSETALHLDKPTAAEENVEEEWDERVYDDDDDVNVDAISLVDSDPVDYVDGELRHRDFVDATEDNEYMPLRVRNDNLSTCTCICTCTTWTTEVPVVYNQIQDLK